MTLEEAVGAQEAELELEAGRTLLNAGIQVGTLEGSENDVFGMIRDVAIGPKDEVFVLDDQQVRVKVYSGVGEFLTSFGRRGEGPGEFRIPVSISVGVDGSVFVLDPGNLRISVFHLADSEYELEREIPLTFPPEDLCVTGDDRLFLLGYREEFTIHEINALGEILHSMAPAVEAEDFRDTRWHLRVKQAYATGFLVCPPDTDFLVFLSKHFGFVQAFDRGGSLAWQHQIEGFKGIRLRQTERGTLQFAPADGNLSTSETAAGIVDSGSERVTIQFGTTRPGTDNDFSVIETRYLSLQNGTEIERRTDLPHIGDSKGSLLVAFENSPFPKISIIHDTEHGPQ